MVLRARNLRHLDSKLKALGVSLITPKVEVDMIRAKIRNFMTVLVKRLLLCLIVLLSKKYPEPTEDNVWHPNARILLGIRNKFLKYEGNLGRRILFDAISRVGIDEYQRHTFYCSRIDFCVDELRESEWLPRSNRPMSFWKEPREVQEGTVFSDEILSKIMQSQGSERSILIHDLIVSAGEERIYKK